MTLHLNATYCPVSQLLAAPAKEIGGSGQTIAFLVPSSVLRNNIAGIFVSTSCWQRACIAFGITATVEKHRKKSYCFWKKLRLRTGYKKTVCRPLLCAHGPTIQRCSILELSTLEVQRTLHHKTLTTFCHSEQTLNSGRSAGKLSFGTISVILHAYLIFDSEVL